MKNVIAIDGPAGAGKSTVARILADKLNYKYLDTGAMYRAVTYQTLKKKIKINNKSEIIRIARELDFKFLSPDHNGITRILVHNKDITDKIRKPKINKYVSHIAKIKEVREALVEKQRKIARQNNIILDGRDIGTRVIPEAEYKFYITASLKERAKRRFQELNKNNKISLKKVENDLKNRDKIDKNREHSPLTRAEDAILIDTTNLSIEEVVNKIINIINSKDMKKDD
ncbi:MAG: (d)CMP kinase [Bacillota bacterium]